MKFHEIDFCSPPDGIFCEPLEKRFFRLQLMESGENEVNAENTNGFLLQDIRRISQIYMQQNIVMGTVRLQLRWNE